MCYITQIRKLFEYNATNLNLKHMWRKLCTKTISKGRYRPDEISAFRPKFYTNFNSSSKFLKKIVKTKLRM